MLKWFSGEEGDPGSGGPGSPLSAAAAAGGALAAEEQAERLTQTEQLVTQLKELIREKDSALRTRDEQLKVEKEACDAKLSKLRLQNKAKVTSLTAQLEELRRQHGGQGTPTHGKKGSSEAGEHASRGKIVLLKKKVEELEQQLSQRNNELETKRKEVESQRRRGEEMDAMLTEKDRKLSEKEDYIVHLQTALAGDQPVSPQHKVLEEGGAMEELQLLVQSLTRKVGEAEERYSLLQEQAESLKELLVSEKEQYAQKEDMYEQNIQTFKDILIQKDKQLLDVNQMHEQELFKLAAKSDASADLEQLLKALKRKLHEKEEVLLGKTQVIDVLQGEVDGRDQQIKELTERLRRLQVERESLASKMEAEKHVMRAQLRDLVEKQQAEAQRLTEQHRSQLDRARQDFLEQLEELRRTSVAAPPACQEASGMGSAAADSASTQRIAELEAQAKQKSEDAGRSEAKFLKMKAWSKSRIRQLEEELKKSQAGGAPPDLTALRSHVTALEEEREETLWKVEQYEELKTKNEMLEAKLVVYEEQQRSLQADLEQFTKRAASQASESGSADDAQSQVLEWQEMVTEAVSARDRAKEEKVAMALRISHMEEEREALASRQQELEEELAQSGGLGQRGAKKLTAPAQRSLQEDFEFDGQVPFQDPRSASESTTPMEGENMGGWWPEYSTPDTDGLRSVVEELELERNQLQEQILGLEERCQDLEDRLQLQSRIEALQNESEKLQSQLTSVRSQQSRDAEKHQLLVGSLNDQLKGLSSTQECLESSLIEKENTLAKTSEKLELIGRLRESLGEKEVLLKDVSDRLAQAEHALDSVSNKCSVSEKQRSELRTEVSDLAQKFSVLKEKTQKQEVTIEALQTELDQTNEELDKLNSAHLEERAQLIHDLQTCEREIDSLKEIMTEKDKDISSLSANVAECTEQISLLKQEVELKGENLVQVEALLRRAEQEAAALRDAQSSDQQSVNSKMSEVVEKLKEAEAELVKAKEDRESKEAEVEQLLKQLEDNKKTVQELGVEVQKQSETHITGLKEQLSASTEQLQESQGLVSQLRDKNVHSEKLQQELRDKVETYEKELESLKEEHDKVQAQAEKHRSEIQALSKQLEEQLQSEELIRKETRENMETIETLRKQIKANDKQTSEKQKFSNELKNKAENISKLKNQLKSTKTEKQQLSEQLELQRRSGEELSEQLELQRRSSEELSEQLELQRRSGEELSRQLSEQQELGSSLETRLLGLTQEKLRLEEEAGESVENISRVTAENESLRAQLSALVTRASQSDALMDALERDKEELTLRVGELNRVLEQSASERSEMLLEKESECSRLSRQLGERQEEVAELQERVRSSSAELQLRDRTAAELQEQFKAEQAQTEETLCRLRGEESRLRSEVAEREAALKEKRDECRGLEEEIAAQKKLVLELREERSQLELQVQARDEMLDNTKQQCQNHKDKLNAMNETLKSQTDRISVMEDGARKLQEQAESRRAELSRLDDRIQTLTEENHRLRAAAESREEEELARHAQVSAELDSQLRATREHNSGLSTKISELTAENQRLREEVDQNIRSVSGLTHEMNSLRELNAGLETHISAEEKRVGGLLKEKEELSAAVDELTNVLQKRELSDAAGLLQKTSECADLSRALREREEQVQRLLEEIDGLKRLETQLHASLTETERTLSERRTQSDAQQNQLLHFQDTVSALREQASVLKSALTDRDALIQQKVEECGVYQKEAALLGERVSRLQAEVESTKQAVEQKDRALDEVSKEFQNHKDELNKRNESVMSLSSQLGAMNQNTAEMEAELTDLRAAAQKLHAENCQLTQEGGRSRAEITAFKDSVRALNEQNARLKSELLNTAAVLTEAREEVANLRSAVGGVERELKAALSEQESLQLSLNQQESLIQKLNGTITEQEQQLNLNAGHNASLCAKVSQLEDSAGELRGQVDGLTAESAILKNALEEKERSSLEYQSLRSDLRAKEAEGERSKEQISRLEESVSRLQAESENLKRALVEREASLAELSKSLQDAQRRADEALLFKTQFEESAELVSQLQSRVQLLTAEYEKLRKPAEETQRAFNNLQEKFAANLEELQEARGRLSHGAEEASELQKLLDDSSREHQAAKATIETLREQLSDVHHKLQKTQELTSSLSREKDEALCSHQASVSLLTVETERLKSQHLLVASQVSALTENLEQREMALHAINSQYSAQAHSAAQLLQEMQKLEEQNKRLSEELSLSRAEHQKRLAAVRAESARAQEEAARELLAEKEESERSRRRMMEQSGRTKEDTEQMASERDDLRAKVSAKDREVSQLTENIEKIEQVLQDSEREWLLVLEKEKQDRTRLAEQLERVEHEKKSKDVKVSALKRDLDSLQEKLAEASSAVSRGSAQLSAKESEASASRVQLERVLASFQEKDEENRDLQQALNSVECELGNLLQRTSDRGSTCSEEPAAASLQQLVKQLEGRHRSEVEALRHQLDEGGRSQEEQRQQIALLRDAVESLQTQLSAAMETVRQAAVQHSSLQGELQAKDEQVNILGVQVDQQKELLAELSQQTRDKDASVARVMESAYNERLKLCEDNASLVARVEDLQRALQTSGGRLEEVSQQLEDEISRHQREVDSEDSEKLELLREKDDLKRELAEVSKEKDAVKKKLQAALVVRKGLLKKLEEHENQKEERVHSEKREVSLLQDKLQEAARQAEARQEQMSLLEDTVLKKEAELVELRTQSERLLERLRSEKQALQSSLDEKEMCLLGNLQALRDEAAAAEQLQLDAAQSERDRSDLIQKVEQLQEAIRTRDNELKEKCSSAAAELEKQLAQVKSEKAVLQKKAQAALLARKETVRKAEENEKKLAQELTELKDDYKALLEQRCQQTNELNALQLNLDEKLRELESLQKTSLSYLDELDTLRQLVEERDKTLQDLKMSLAEKESQCHSLSRVQSELDTVKSQAEKMSLEMASKEDVLVLAEQRAAALKSQLHLAEENLEKARDESRERAEEMEKYKKTVVEEHVGATEESKAALEQMKVELEAALALASQKSQEVLTVQETLSETRLQRTETDRVLDSVKLEKENAFQLVRDLRGEVATLHEQLTEALNEQRHRNTPENFEAKLKETEEAVLDSRARAAEKEELIAALELQLQQQLKNHEAAIERVRVETDELQKSQEDVNRANKRDRDSKTSVLTRKLQAALVSRKELLKESAALKEEAEKLSTRIEAKTAECSLLESSVFRLKQLNADLEASVSSLHRERDELDARVDGLAADNHSLSAACDSLKLTIQNITQQKQAFSCQLESLKDSQTDDLSKWKSRHAELKQDYESLLEAYENVSSEMDKMRQLLEGAKRERQEALRKAHQQQAELEKMEKQTRDMEEENQRMKERMRKSSKEKLQRIKDLEEENQRNKLEWTEGNTLTVRNTDLEDEVRRLSESSERLRGTLSQMQAENSRLQEQLDEASGRLENKHLESNTYTNNMQLKLDEALVLNNSLTAQIEAQKTELGAQVEINNLLQKEKRNLSERIEEDQNDHEWRLGEKEAVVAELRDVINRHGQETIRLNEKVRILEDDKCLLQEELESVQEASDKVKNENEHLETVILQNSERIEELNQSVSAWQTQNAQLASRLAAIKEQSDQVRQEKEEEQLRLVREFEEKLRTMQRGSDGSKNTRNELRELLREKHLEINQLQQNCIRYQEVILDLERSLKSSRSAGELLEREVKRGSEKISTLEERNKEAEAELITNRNLVQEATEKVQSVQAQKEQLLLEMSQQTRTSQEKKQSVDERQINAYEQNQLLLQQQIEELNELKNTESLQVDELRQCVDALNLQINTLRRAAETNEAKLSALSSTPQGADATRRWSDMYQRTLSEKDNQLLEQGFVIKRFLEDMRVKDKEVNELRVNKSRLERTLNDYSVAAAAQQRQLFVMSASNAELSESAELLAVQAKELAAQLEKTERDKDGMSRRLVDKEDVISRLQLSVQQGEELNADADAQLLLLQTQSDRLQADCEKQEGISLQLKQLLQSKDAEISSLLSCRDGQMSGYLEQLQANYRSQAAVYEDRLTSSRYQREKADQGLRGLEAKVKSLEIKVNKSVQEKEQTAAKMESFKNSMVSLQSERERLVSEYRMLEAKSELGLKGRDGSADGEGGAAKGLKHEIRKLLHQMDDLNSENAMLRAQLVRYREDLNQVLSLKDNQLKVLLKKQQDVIRTLETQKVAADKQSRESRLELQKEEEDVLKLTARVSQLETELSAQTSTDVGKVISDLQAAVAAKAAECSDLRQEVVSQKTVSDRLRAKIQLVENETDKKLAEAEDKYNSELDAFEREVELMRNEHETAEGRVADLARDLLQAEQRLSEADTQSGAVKAQNESLCRAMAALQDDRDQLIQDFKILRQRYDEELQETRAALNKVERALRDATSELAAFAKERDVLVQRVDALEGGDTDAELNKLLDEMTKALSEKEAELKKAAVENAAYGRQLSAFSRSMASLQNDRDRLMDELAGTRRADESGRGSSPETPPKSEGRERDGRETDELRQSPRTSGEDVSSSQRGADTLRADGDRRDSAPVKGAEEAVSRLEAERVQLHRDLQRCSYEIQQRDQYFQQLNAKLQQAVEEKGAVAVQLRSVSQTLRDTQDRCHWLETQGQAQGSVFAEVAPGAPQERSHGSMSPEPQEAAPLRERLLELEHALAEERSRRETAEESLRLADQAKSVDAPRDFSIEMAAEDEWEALSLDPAQPLLTRQVKGGVVALRRWLRGRSLYFSRLLTSRARSRHLFLFYLLTLHVLLLMCLSGAL